jgi:hypothetical protein
MAALFGHLSALERLGMIRFVFQQRISCPLLISAVNVAACLPSIVYRIVT